MHQRLLALLDERPCERVRRSAVGRCVQSVRRRLAEARAPMDAAAAANCLEPRRDRRPAIDGGIDPARPGARPRVALDAGRRGRPRTSFCRRSTRTGRPRVDPALRTASSACHGVERLAQSAASRGRSASAPRCAARRPVRHRDRTRESAATSRGGSPCRVGASARSDGRSDRPIASPSARVVDAPDTTSSRPVERRDGGVGQLRPSPARREPRCSPIRLESGSTDTWYGPVSRRLQYTVEVY